MYKTDNCKCVYLLILLIKCLPEIWESIKKYRQTLGLGISSTLLSISNTHPRQCGAHAVSENLYEYFYKLRIIEIC